MKTVITKRSVFVPVRELIASHESRLGLTTKGLAEKLGYEKGNFVSMLKSGAVRPPIEKIPRICEVLGIDLGYFTRCMDEEYGTTYNHLIEAGSKRTPITANEEHLILRLRQVSGGMDVNLDDYPQEQSELIGIFQTMCEKAMRDHTGDIARLSAKPRSAVGKPERESALTPESALIKNT